MEKLTDSIAAMMKLELQLTKEVDSIRHKMVSASLNAGSGPLAEELSPRGGGSSAIDGGRRDPTGASRMSTLTAAGNGGGSGGRAMIIPAKVQAIRDERRRLLAAQLAAETANISSAASETEDF